jgi:hypothetical protein
LVDDPRALLARVHRVSDDGKCVVLVIRRALFPRRNLRALEIAVGQKIRSLLRAKRNERQEQQDSQHPATGRGDAEE